MKRIGRSTKTDTRLEVTPAYDVRSAGNRIIVGSVRYGFFSGERWCFSIALHNGQDAWGQPLNEYDAFEPRYGSPPWTLPVPQSKQATDLDLATFMRRHVEHQRRLLTAAPDGVFLDLAAPETPTDGGGP